MQVTVIGRHMDIKDAIRSYAEEKVGRISKIFDVEPMNAEVVLHVEKNKSIANRDIAEITLHMKGAVVRAEEASSDMYAAIDLAAEKAESQMRKYKSRVIDRRKGGVAVVKTAAGDEQLVEQEEEGTVVRTKVVDLKPMSEEEAMLQVELLGHDFFVFRHAESGLVNVLYRRNDGGYGLIKPSI